MIFYAVPASNPLAPPSVFVDRWWDASNGYVRTGIGTDDDWRIYRGPIPVIPVKKPEGKPEWWTHGMLYTEYLAGAYTNSGPCIPVPPLEIAPQLRGFGQVVPDVVPADLAQLRGFGQVVPNVQIGLDVSPSLSASGQVDAAIVNEWSSEPMAHGMGQIVDGPPQTVNVVLGFGQVVIDPTQDLTPMRAFGAVST